MITSCRKTTVLVADDDPALVALVTVLLEREGYSVATAHNGQEALDQATASPADLVLLDLRMPVMDGWACYSSLKQHPETKTIPVIVMSAEAGGATRGAELGVDYFLSKPFEVNDLLSSVKRFAGRASRDPGSASLPETLPEAVST